MVSDVTLSSSNTSASGTLTWSWVQGTSSCNGGCNISYAKLTDDPGTNTGEGGGGGGGGGIFGDILRSSVIGYHLDGFTKNGVQVYMPVTPGFKALKGAQEWIKTFSPNLARKIRGIFDYFEQKADSNKEGFLYQAGTHVFPILGKIAEGSLKLIGEEKFIDKAYKNTTISIEEFKDLENKGLAIVPKVVKDMESPKLETSFMDLVLVY